MAWIEMVITIVCSVMASSGFWAWWQKRAEKNDAKIDMLIGLGHDRITFLGMKYIERGWITEDEYDNLNDYLYRPYKELGGNGSAKKIMDEVSKLELRRNGYNEQ